MFAAVVGLSLGLQPLSECELTDAPAAIVLNQIGFEQHGPKAAILHSATPRPVPWQLVDETGTIRAQGRSRPFGHDASAGESLHRIELDDVGETGAALQLIACGARSRPFSIGPMPWGTFLRLLAR